ncbi:MAG: hypothetical protein U0T36_07525 [Saprospiraceae bacterium]
MGTGSSFTTPSISSSTTYVAWCKSNGCYSANGTPATATINPNPTVSVGNDFSICQGQSVILTANASSGTSPYTYTWNQGLGTGSSKTINPSNTTTYIVTVSDNKTCTNSDNVVVTVSPGPNLNIQINKSEICTNESVTLTSSVTGGTGTPTYQWQVSNDGVTFSDITGALSSTYTDNNTPVAQRWYRLVVTTGSCEVTSYAIKRTVIPSPTATITNSSTICAGQSTTLSVSNFTPSSGCFDLIGYESGVDARATLSSSNSAVLTYGNINYNSSNNGNNTFQINRLTSGSATVDYTLSFTQQDFSNYQTISFRIADAGGLIFTAFIGDAVDGFTSLGTSSSGNAGVHTFNLPTNNSLKDQTNAIRIRISATDVGAIGGFGIMRIADIQLCGSSILWTPGNFTTPSITVNPSSTTTYSAVVKYGDCSQTLNSTVTIGNVTSNAGTDFTKTCTSNASGAQIGMTAVSGVTYSWSPATGLSSATVSNPTANPTTTTTYTLTATTTATGCTASDQVVVTVNLATPISNAGLDFAKTCAANVNGAQIGMTAVAGVTYSWSPATGLSSATVSNPIANPSTTTTYILTATTTASGCTASDQVLVTVNTTPPTAMLAPTSRRRTSTKWRADRNDSSRSNILMVTSDRLEQRYCLQSDSQPNNDDDLYLDSHGNSYRVYCERSSGSDRQHNTTNSKCWHRLYQDQTSNASGAQIGMTAVAGVTYSWSPATGLSSATVSNPTANLGTTTTYTDSFHDNSSQLYRERSSNSHRQHNTTDSNAGTDFMPKTYIQCKWRADRNDSSSRSNILMVTSDRLEQRYSLQSNSQPDNDDNLYLDSNGNSNGLYSEHQGSSHRQHNTTDSKCWHRLHEDVYI